jgi:hypothetical protein
MDIDSIPQTETIVILPPPPRPVAEPSEIVITVEPRITSVLLGRLLKMADNYRCASQFHQASEMYFHILESYAGTAEAVQAQERLIEMADEQERNGETRQARSIFERLL